VTVFLATLLVWFALSVPATLIIGRIMAGAGRDGAAPVPARGGLTSQDGLTRR
jgi:hypothetical protein